MSRYYAERGRAVEPSQILLTASTSEAYSFLFKLLTDPGDEILTPRPSYPLFEFLAALELVNVRQYPLRYDGTWHLDFAALKDSVTPRTRAIVVVNPNNPTGSFLKPDEWERLESLGVPILCDEVFSDYELAPVAARCGPGRALTFSMSGLSKSAGLPQMKLGWIVASGPEGESALQALGIDRGHVFIGGDAGAVGFAELLEASDLVRGADSRSHALEPGAFTDRVGADSSVTGIDG